MKSRIKKLLFICRARREAMKIQSRRIRLLQKEVEDWRRLALQEREFYEKTFGYRVKAQAAPMTEGDLIRCTLDLSQSAIHSLQDKASLIARVARDLVERIIRSQS